jgi:competence protein ComEC
MFPTLEVDILKVGHHGSKGSTSDLLLDHIKPSIALVSAGENNRYQHPHSEVLEKLSIRKIAMFRTDLQGAILYHFKGNSGTFSTHPPYDEVY